MEISDQARIASITRDIAGCCWFFIVAKRRL
jgi:hypothetical protein